MMKNSISVIVPAYNEEKNILSAVKSVKNALLTFGDYEIIIVNDGSTDQTGAVARKLAKKDRHIKILNHIRNMGIGIAIKDGIAASRKEYVTEFHGDNDSSGESLHLMIGQIGKADFISAYTANPQVRSTARRILSKTFVSLMNLLFGLRLKYYTGYFICKTKLLQSIPITSNGFAFYAEAKVRLITFGATYHEVPSYHTGRKYGISKAASFASILETVRTLVVLFTDIHFRKSRSGLPNQVRRTLSRVHKS